MKSGWSWFNKALEGDLGRRAKTAAETLVVAVVASALIRPSIFGGLLRSDAAWMSREVARQIQPMIMRMDHLRSHLSGTTR